MRKVTMYPGIRILVFLVVLLVSQGLTTEIARAAEKRPKELKEAEESFTKASKTMGQAKDSGNLPLAEKALTQAENAAVQLTISSEWARQMGEVDVARMTADIAGQTSNVVSDILKFSREASTITLSFAARETGNLELASASLVVAERLCKLVYTINVMADERGDPELRQTTRNAANSIRETIQQVAQTARNISRTSTNVKHVEEAQKLLRDSQNIQFCVIEEEEAEPCIGPECDPCASCV